MSFYPENGTAYLQAGLGSTLMFSFSDGTIFNMVSVDLAEYSTVVPVLTVTFVGYRQDGSSVTTSLTPDGIIDGNGPLADFETFYFDKEWTDLTRVEIPTYGWSLDNLVVSQIPEPASGVLLLAGSLLLWRLVLRRNTRFFVGDEVTRLTALQIQGKQSETPHVVSYNHSWRGARTIGLVMLCVATQCHGQGTILIPFDGPPPQPPPTAEFVQQYYESGMWFSPLGPVGPGNGFVRQGGGVSFYPENGTPYLQAGLGNTLKFSFLNGAVFDLVSVDLAEYSTAAPVLTVEFFGYRNDGSIVTTSVTLDGIIDGTGPLADFETFYFDTKDWSGLDRVEIPTYGWSLDNLVVATIPEPTVGALLLVGGLLLWRLRRSGFVRSSLYWPRRAP